MQLAAAVGTSSRALAFAPCALAVLAAPIAAESLVAPGAAGALVASASVGVSALMSSLAVAEPWWDERTANMLGAFAGAGVGVLGALLGSVGSFCANRGKARGVVLGTQATLAVLGALLCIVALTAWLLGQPFHVGYPLALSGFILLVVMGALYPVMRNRYREAEQRKLAAAELRRG
jgi:membrane associated rhomboid family serine protease